MTGMCLSGLIRAMILYKMLLGQIGRVSKVEYLLDVRQALSSIHIAWTVGGMLVAAVVPLVALRLSATGFFCSLAVFLQVFLTILLPGATAGRRGFWWSGVLRMHRDARAALGLNAPPG